MDEDAESGCVGAGGMGGHRWRNQRTTLKDCASSLLALCAFDGKILTYRKHGTEHNFPQGRGLYEPSLTKFDGQYFLTMRANHSAFVTRGKDGIHFESIREWKFDDGQVLGSYNTQQHWVAVGCFSCTRAKAPTTITSCVIARRSSLVR